MKLLWLDLETCGLDPEKHRILEVAAAVADFESPFDILKFCDTPVRLNDWDAGLKSMDDKVHAMHSRSGLLAAVKETFMTLTDVEDHLVDIVPDVAEVDEKWILAGSSIHFDLGMIRKQMPRLAKRLSYRLYDTRNLQLFCRSMGMPKMEKGGAHRAWPDLLESVEHARACATWLGLGSHDHKD